VIEPSSRTTLRANELAIPIRASDMPTERISELDRLQFALAAAMPSPAARWAPRGAVIGLVLTTLAFGILLTSTFNRSWRFQGTRLLAPHFIAAHSAEKAPSLSPAPSPLRPPLVEPIVVAAAPVQFDAQPLHHGRARGTHAISSPRPTSPAGSEPTDSSPAAAAAPAPPAAKWVDPFAE
jgi:hypothetical protein